jgi:hypothetical protein
MPVAMAEQLVSTTVKQLVAGVSPPRTPSGFAVTARQNCVPECIALIYRQVRQRPAAPASTRNRGTLRMAWKRMRRRVFAVDSIAEGGITLCDPAKTRVERYRFRGAKISRPYNIEGRRRGCWW